MDGICCLIGLGNPGPKYSQTRHNAGAWFIESLSRKFSTSLKLDTKRKANIGTVTIEGRECRLVIPETYMNESGLPIRMIMDFYKLSPAQILVAHDELDIMPGDIRLKKGGGHGGHNGLRDMFSHLSDQSFARLRIGIGHPGDKNMVSNYVLKPPTTDDKILIERSIDKALNVVPQLVTDAWDKAVYQLHST